MTLRRLKGARGALWPQLTLIKTTTTTCLATAERNAISMTRKINQGCSGFLPHQNKQKKGGAVDFMSAAEFNNSLVYLTENELCTISKPQFSKATRE